MKKPKDNIRAIRAVRRKLATVNVMDVAKHMNCSRFTIYYHLKEVRTTPVSLPHLKKISDAIDAVKAAAEKSDKQILSTLTKS